MDTHVQVGRIRTAVSRLVPRRAEALIRCRDLTIADVVLESTGRPGYFAFGNCDFDTDYLFFGRTHPHRATDRRDGPTPWIEPGGASRIVLDHRARKPCNQPSGHVADSSPKDARLINFVKRHAFFD